MEIKITQEDVKNNPQTLDKILQRKGVNVEILCGQGICGNCRCKKIEGEVNYLSEVIGYHKEDEILPCIATLKSESILLAV